jgi:hypothetical protein
MSPRRTAGAVTLTSDDQPTRCFCGAAEYDYSFVRFPMAHVSRCRNCGFEHRCVLNIRPAKATGPAKQAASGRPQEPPLGFPPFWY